MMQLLKLRFLLPHVLVTLLFAAISLLYFYPVLSGKALVQSDIVQFKGMQRQVLEHRATFNEEPYWIDNAFVGMPTYQITPRYPFDVLRYIDSALRFLPRPADMLFLYLFFFYLFAQSRRFSIPISIFGALAYGFSTYYIVILMVGHNTKAMALAYAPLLFLGLFQVLIDKKKLGFVWFALGLALQLHANHLQMTYYTLIMAGISVLFWSFWTWRKDGFQLLLKPLGKLIAAGLIALLLNAQGVLATLEYTKFSTRSASELTINPDGSPKEATAGLSFDYITEYSYGIFETLTFFAPNVVGGSSSASFPMDSDFVKFLRTLDAESANTIFRYARPYWGDQPIVAAPVYLGIVVLFFALLGLLTTNRKTRLILLITIAVSLLFSWGKHVPALTQFFIDYLPLYNKFRAVSSAQIMIMFCVPFAAMLGVQFLVKDSSFSRKKLLKCFYVFSFFVALILFLIAGAKGFFSFTSSYEPFAQYPEVMKPLKEARAALLWDTIIQILVFVLLIVGVILLYWRKKIASPLFVLLLIVLAFSDLWKQNRSYFDEDQFVSSYQQKKAFVAIPEDKEILKDTSRYRVFEPRLGFSNARTAYFHRTIGGYHGAKPAALQEVYDFYLQQEDSIVLDMLNVKYVLDPALENGYASRQSALGAAWLVDELISVNSANEEMIQLGKINPKTQALSQELEATIYKSDASDKITLTAHRNNLLQYNINVSHKRLAVFSEMYYPNGWKVYLNNDPINHFNVNYLLRGVVVPPGSHKLIFKFEPDVIRSGTLFMASGWLIFLLSIGLILRKPKAIG
ncbi:MAG: YfhO family protein [Bacteroidetes bacterium]|nr:YfhO family protein [Bacteroidota bacterium]